MSEYVSSIHFHLELAAAQAGVTLRNPTESKVEAMFVKPLPYRCQMDDCEHALYGMEH